MLDTNVTASTLYDLVSCPHRVTLDRFGDSEKRDKVSAFVQMLWERGSAYEATIINKLAGSEPVLDLSSVPDGEREARTLAAMQQGVPLIYQGRLRAADLLGSPDLLRREGERYVPIDIKSGQGEAGGGDDDAYPTPKKHYAVQLGLYVDVLEQLGFSVGRLAYVWDILGNEVRYDFTVPYGSRSPRSLWDDYQEALAAARAIVSQRETSWPAYAASCKLCHWYSHCMDTMKTDDDITLMSGLGRKLKEVMRDRIPTMAALAEANPGDYIVGGRTAFRGLGPERLLLFHERAKLIKSDNPQPRLTGPVTLPASKLEIFFDIEADPMQDICYLHGFLERRDGDNGSEQFVAFFADEPIREGEEQAFRETWEYIRANPDAVLFYYSKYERTMYRKLQARYPSVCTAKEVEDLFDPAKSVDLYFGVVEPSTIWPTRDHSIKTLAKFLGFAWRDTEPSGAASIEWYQRWTSQRDQAIKNRILEYNEDDCRATRVVLDGVRGLT